MEKRINKLTPDKVKLKVSSVLSNSKKEFGADFMIDGKEDTGWSSNQGSTQSIVIEFKNPINIYDINEFEFISQGGFCPKNITFMIYTEDITINKQKTKCYTLKEFPDIKDTSESQILSICKEDIDKMLEKNYLNDENEEKQVTQVNNKQIYGILLKMISFYDLYGRVTFYDIKLY